MRSGCSARIARDYKSCEASALKRGDLVLVEANDIIPADGEVVEGVASVNESAVTGESAPVLREAGGDFSSVTGGTRVLSDWIVVRVTSREGEGFLDRMIAMVEGAKRARTPNEIALSILLAMHDDRVPAGDRNARAVLAVRGDAAGQGLGRHAHRARGAAGVPDPDDDRRACCPPSASRAWIAWCAPTSSRLPAAPSKRRATSMCCCSTRPARSRSAIATRPSFQPAPGVDATGARRCGAARLAGR